MSKSSPVRRSARRRRRYIFRELNQPQTKVYLVYYYNTQNVILMTDGPFTNEPDAYEKMREFLLKGYCAWMVTYND